MLLIVGLAFLAIGIVGIFVPLLPTTPFLLISLAAFSRSSPRFEQWLLDHPRLGPPLQDWQRYGAIRTRAKILATFFIAVSFSFPLFLIDIRLAWRLSAGGLMFALLLFIWSRPSRAPADSMKAKD